jgi:6-phosphofructokinase
VLATQFGSHAVRLVIEGKFGEMVCYQPPSIMSVPILAAVNKLSRVDANSSAVQAARALGISFGDTADLAGPFGINKPAVAEVEEAVIETLASLGTDVPLAAVEPMPVEWEAAAAYADAAMW